ncbi:unnamed protein product, partial [Symbiodinium microadriaticum]
DRITYNAAISACEKSQEWRQALTLLRQAEWQRMQLGIISYNAAISACDKGGQWELALHLLYEAVWKRLRPQLTSYNAAASACAKGLRWYEAAILLGQLNEAGLEGDVVSLTAAITACKFQWPLVLALLDRWRFAGNSATYTAADAWPGHFSFIVKVAACQLDDQWNATSRLLSLFREGSGWMWW